MAIVDLCRACMDGHHESCEGGTGGQTGPGGQMDGTFFCCTCGVCEEKRQKADQDKASLEERRFAEMIRNVELSKAEIAILRCDCDLPYSREDLGPHSHGVLLRRLQMMAWGKIQRAQ